MPITGMPWMSTSCSHSIAQIWAAVMTPPGSVMLKASLSFATVRV